MALRTVEQILESAEKVEVEAELDALIDSYLAGMRISYGEDEELQNEIPVNTAVAALFDLCVNALYARAAIKGAKWIYCSDKEEETGRSHFKGHYLYYPFVAACPRCSVTGRFEKAESRKPPSGSIGDLNAIVISAIYARIARESKGEARVLRVPGTGDVDLVFVEEDDVCVAEIKASPLVSYPLAVASDPIEDADNETGLAHEVGHCEATATRLSKDEIYLYIPHADKYIPLGARTDKSWPMKALTKHVSGKSRAKEIAQSWQKLFQIYSDKSLRRTDDSWWLVNGCGKPRAANFTISDGKNMPGIDRTDDLKKGTYQVLKMGASLKESTGGRVRAALVSNIHAVIHDELYVDNLADVVWFKDGSEDHYVTYKDDREWRIRSEGIFNLYDGIICITESRFRDSWLESIASVKVLK